MAPKYILEQFLEAELLVNITEHQVSAKSFLAGMISVDCLQWCMCYCTLVISALDSETSL